MKVRDVMSPEVPTVHPEAPLWEIARLVAKCRAGAVVVVDDQGAPAGMVSEDELFLKERRFGFTLKLHSLFGEPVNLEDLPNQYEAACHLKARDVMRRWVPSVEADSDVQKLVELMMANGLTRVVVVDHDKVVGIVTRADLISRMLKVN